MPSVFAHGLFAGALASASSPNKVLRKTLVLATICSILPDADVMAFDLGISYRHILGHRGITHSLFFALLMGFFITFLFYPDLKKYSRNWWCMVMIFFISTASHGLFDAMTDGGLGVAFFAPFDEERYFLPFRPIEVSPIGIESFFTERGWTVIKNEAIWIGIPSLLIWVVGKIVHKKIT